MATTWIIVSLLLGLRSRGCAAHQAALSRAGAMMRQVRRRAKTRARIVASLKHRSDGTAACHHSYLVMDALRPPLRKPISKSYDELRNAGSMCGRDLLVHQAF
jgi:hypothetical protein